MSITTMKDAINPLSATFFSGETENNFRESNLKKQKTKVSQISLIALPTVFIFLYSDFAFHSGGLLAAHVVIRTAVALLTAALFLFARRTRSGTRLEIALAAWITTGLGGVLFIDYWRPRDSFSHLLIDLVYLACLYSVVPMRMAGKVLIGAFFTAGCLVVSFIFKDPYTSTESIAVIAAFAVTNIVGLYIARRHNISKRDCFRMWNREKTLREELQASIDEVKVLRGLLRICANCKRIHTREDNWQQIEVYIRDHSEATFTHGICPDCSRELYPDLKF